MFFKELQTDRLFLKNISSDDRDFIFTVFSNDDVNRYLYDAEPLTDISGADDIINFYLVWVFRVSFCFLRSKEGTLYMG